MAEMEATAGAPGTQKVAELTEYVILSAGEAEGSSIWCQMGTVRARSAEDAIRRHGEEGRHVAIPARSWRPINAKSKQTTTLDLKPAT